MIGLVGLLSSSFATVWFLDARYAPMAAFEDVQWSALKSEIRQLRDKLEQNPDDKDTVEELQDVIDRLCRAFPDDRECK